MAAAATPSLDVSVDTELALKSPVAALRGVVSLGGDGWAEVAEGDLSAEQLSAAMTNHVFMVAGPLGKLLVRVYGGGDADAVEMFSREDEVELFVALSSKGLGPRCLGVFRNGRVEEFLEGRTLSAAELHDPGVAQRIARAMAATHRVDRAALGAAAAGGEEPLVWARMARWLAEAGRACGEGDEAVRAIIEEIRGEEVWLRARLEGSTAPATRCLVFSHNDLQAGNIMEVDGRMVFIDYEYAGPNPAAYDLANHFCERMADYHSETPHVLDFSKYPGEELRRTFTEDYLQGLPGGGGGTPVREEVEGLADAAHRFAAASHAFWAVWGCIKAITEDCHDFDYLGYAQGRLGLYRKWKADIV